jgi:hypothetical protein
MTLYLLETEKIGVSVHRPLSQKRPISDPGAKSFGREPQFSQRKSYSEGGSLLKLPQLRKSESDACGNFFFDDFHKLLGYPSQKRARISTVPTSSATKLLLDYRNQNALLI